MYQQPPEQNVPNGVPPQYENKKTEKLQQLINGVNSAHSSRSSSPSLRLGQIPSSQLPPSRTIPASQLPPSISPITTLTNKITGLGISQNTPINFSTSTPNMQSPASFRQNGAFSPISVPKPSVPQQSADLQNVPLTSSSDSVNNIVASSSQPNIQTSTSSSGPGQASKTSYTQSQGITGHFNSGPAFPTNQPNQNPTQQTPSGIFQSQGQNIQKPTTGIPSHGQVINPTSSTGTTGSFPLQRQINQSPFQNQNYRTPNPGTSRSFPPQGFQNSSQNVGECGQSSAPLTGITGSFSSQSQNPAISSGLPYPPSQPKLPNRIPQVSPFTVNQSGQNYIPIAPSNETNLPTSANVAGDVRNFSSSPNTPSQYLPLNNQNMNQFKPSNISPGNLPQPPAGQSTGPPSISQRANLHSNRYPLQPNVNILQQQNSMPPQNYQQVQQPYGNRIALQQPQLPSQAPSTYMHSQKTYLPQPQNNYGPQQPFQGQQQGVTQAGFNKYWGMENYDLLQIPNILPEVKEKAPRITLGQEVLDQANCSPDIFRCTMTKIPENNSLLQKSRLPLGVLIHPFKDLSHLPVIQCNVIVRCRACRTYINPFVFFVESKRWKCNLCYRINELPEEFLYDPVSKTYGDPSRRPEIKSSTIEYIAPAEYMLRPPQPAVYLYLLDVSRLAIESGYLHSVCNILIEELSNLPGDARTQIGFLAYDSALHFYSFAEGLSRPHEMTILDIEDVFLPTPDSLLVNLKDKMELVDELLSQLPTRYNNTFDNNSAMGAALQVAYRMMMATGGRVTVFQASLPNVGPGALTVREDPSQRTTVEVSLLNPANDFYKRLALECSGQQIAVDLFIMNSTYVDIATISGISRFSGGCIHHFPLFKISKTLDCERFQKCFRRYISRKIGFEAVMRIRCTRGLSIHTFHGNFFVRSTDLLSLPNINPDAGFGMQVAIEENLSDVKSVCFQAALLYTSSKGERRIRVHTMCLPVVSVLQDIIHSADQECIIGLLSKMAVDRSMQSSLLDAREAFINVAIDILSSYKMSQNLGGSTSGLIAPNCLKLLPLYISALLKHTAFRTGMTTRADDRVKAMIDMKTKPLYILIQMIYPDLYPINNLENQQVTFNAEEEQVPLPPRLHLSARSLDSKGAFLMDMGEHMIIMVFPNVSLEFLNEALGIPSYDAVSDQMFEIPVINNVRNQRLHQFINYLNEDKPFAATIQVMRDNSPNRVLFLERLIEDRVENALSYHEFLQHLKTQVK